MQRWGLDSVPHVLAPVCVAQVQAANEKRRLSRSRTPSGLRASPSEAAHTAPEQSLLSSPHTEPVLLSLQDTEEVHSPLAGGPALLSLLGGGSAGAVCGRGTGSSLLGRWGRGGSVLGFQPGVCPHSPCPLRR